MSEDKSKELQQKYNDIFSRYRKAMWTSVASMAALAGTVLYSKYQLFRKQKIILERQNQIKNQKDELYHLQHESKQLNKQLMEEFKVILKNLKQNITEDPNIKGISTSLRNQINNTFEEMNLSLRNKLQKLKNYNYKEGIEKWYLANVVSNQGFKFNTLSKIQVVEAHWNNHKDSFNQGYTWRKDGKHSVSAETGAEQQKAQSGAEQQKAQFEKMRAYFERKNGYEGRGVEIRASSDNLGNSLVEGKRMLQVKYKCWGFDIKTGLFTVPLLPVKPEKSGQQVKTVAIEEGKESYIECKNDEWRQKE